MSATDPMIGAKLLSSLRVVDLKEELEKRSLSKSGSKKDLADRLRNYVLQNEQKSSPTKSQQAADEEEELENISLQEKQMLAEKNPFLRDYFASQAELFHSQKVAKKLLLEEEARRESESAPSADEGSAAEESESPKSRQVLRKNSRTEPAATVSHSHQQKQKEEVTPMPQPEPEEPEVPPVQQPVRATRQRLRSAQEPVPQPSPEKARSEPKMVETIAEEKPLEETKPKPEPTPQESARSRSSSGSSSGSRSSSPDSGPRQVVEKEKKEEPRSQPKPKEDEKPRNGDSATVSKLPEKKEIPADNIQKKTLSPLKAEDKPIVSEVVESKKEVKEPEQQNHRASPRRSRFSNRPASPVVEKEPVEESVMPTKEEDSNLQNGDGDVLNLTAETTVDLPVQEAKLPSPKKSPSKTVPEREQEAKLPSPKKSPSKTVPERSDKETDAAQRTEPAPAPVAIRKDRIGSVAQEEEEVLDYGDEEKIDSVPRRFDWTRRVLHVKSKAAPKSQVKKWPQDFEEAFTENVDTDLMLTWFTDVRLPASVDLEEKPPKSTPPSSGEEGKNDLSRKFSFENESRISGQMENITVHRKVSLVPLVKDDNDNEDADKDLSPPRNPASEVILISNLTRPFTLPQLKELLQRTGNLLDLWVDKIKSKCIVKYEKQEEAFETRAALHGITWPQSNPKALHVDYSSQDVLDEHKARDSGEIKPSQTERPVGSENMPVREWDVGKRPKSRSPRRKRSRSRSTSRERKRSRRSQSPGRKRHSVSPHHDRKSRGDGKEHEPLGKALDELFRKTVATPSIYWLPLTSAMIAEKEEMRRKRMQERERRLAELNKRRSPR